MKPEINHFLDIEQMEHLISLGVDVSKSSMMWIYKQESCALEIYSEYYKKIGLLYTPAFTLEDLLEILPTDIEYVFKDGIKRTVYLSLDKTSITYFVHDKNVNDLLSAHTEHGKDALNATYKMLLWLLNNNYLINK